MLLQAIPTVLFLQMTIKTLNLEQYFREILLILLEMLTQRWDIKKVFIFKRSVGKHQICAVIVIFIFIKQRVFLVPWQMPHFCRGSSLSSQMPTKEGMCFLDLHQGNGKGQVWVYVCPLTVYQLYSQDVGSIHLRPMPGSYPPEGLTREKVTRRNHFRSG